MLRAQATTPDGRPVLVLGLSAENIRRLQEDKPIKLDIDSHGLDVIVVIVAGDTEESIAVKLTQFIGADTHVSVDERLFGGGD